MQGKREKDQDIKKEREQEKRLAEDCVDHYLIGSGLSVEEAFLDNVDASLYGINVI